MAEDPVPRQSFKEGCRGMDVIVGYPQGSHWFDGTAWTGVQNSSLNFRAVQKPMCSVPGRVNFAA